VHLAAERYLYSTAQLFAYGVRCTVPRKQRSPLHAGEKHSKMRVYNRLIRAFGRHSDAFTPSLSSHALVSYGTGVTLTDQRSDIHLNTTCVCGACASAVSSVMQSQTPSGIMRVEQVGWLRLPEISRCCRHTSTTTSALKAQWVVAAGWCSLAS